MDDNADDALLEPDDLEELPEDLEDDEGDLPGFEDDELGDVLVEDLSDDLVADIDEVGLDDEVDDTEAEAAPRPVAHGDDDEEEEDDDEVDPDDVEASLDVILKDRLVIEDAAADDEDETPEPEERGEASSAVVPKRPDEFVCQSCFLVKHPSQLADAARQLCRDCV